jgi:hypothetical protein
MLARDELDDHVRAAAAVYRGVKPPAEELSMSCHGAAAPVRTAGPVSPPLFLTRRGDVTGRIM